MERYLFVAQRLTAMLLAPLVIVHLGLILYAVQHGLSGAEILSRTQGSLLWAVFYGAFVLAAAIHAPIGIRNILREWTGLSQTIGNGIAIIFALFLLLAGFRAVIAVV